ncbi:MAG TPA: hypothetical protein VFI37_05295 [Gaiellaceae bacterium]|jgi:hypothetical protein|nr:hypothetical protein [Gaiellaceae bacterium]
MRSRRLLVAVAALALPAAVSVAAGLADPQGTARVLLRRTARRAG